MVLQLYKLYRDFMKSEKIQGYCAQTERSPNTMLVGIGTVSAVKQPALVLLRHEFMTCPMTILPKLVFIAA